LTAFVAATRSRSILISDASAGIPATTARNSGHFVPHNSDTQPRYPTFDRLASLSLAQVSRLGPHLRLKANLKSVDYP